MKPSEFILNTRYLEICPENKLHRKILDDFTLNDLDAKFIDREEIKDKINKKIREYDYQLGEFSYTKKYRQIKEERIEELKEILELIDI
jgi:hypothetical protein